jgi:hypothetical protein
VLVRSVDKINGLAGIKPLHEPGHSTVALKWLGSSN